MDLESLHETPAWQWPKDAGSTIYKALVNRQASESKRLAAAELAGDLVVMNEEIATALLAIACSSDEPEELRGRAAIALGPVLEQASNEEFEGEFDDPEAVPISMNTYEEIKSTLEKLYADASIPKYIRRRILEASVRAGEDWHASAIRAAYASGDRDWMLTAVFSMEYIRGFDDQILESLGSADVDIHYHAIRAAGNWELGAAWPHIIKLLQDPATPKPLLLAAIEAAGSIRPKEAGECLVHLADSDDEEIADAADEAMSIAEIGSDDVEEEENEDDEDESEDDADEEEDDEEWLN